MSHVKAVPEGYQTVTPYLIMSNASDAIAFYTKAFGAKELARLTTPTGAICHAEIQLGTSRLMLADEFPEMNARSAQSLGGTPMNLHLYVEDVDSMFAQAIAAGAKELRPVENQFYGDRSGMITDPFGLIWNISSHVEDVSMEEIYKRFETISKERA